MEMSKILLKSIFVCIFILISCGIAAPIPAVLFNINILGGTDVNINWLINTNNNSFVELNKNSTFDINPPTFVDNNFHYKDNQHGQPNDTKSENQIDIFKIYLLTTVLLIFVILFILIGVSVALRSNKKAHKLLKQKNKQIEEQKLLIEKKNRVLGASLDKIHYQNKSITQSIKYANQIQEALFFDKKLLKTILDESFILFMPRDVVSGDFYWFSEVDKFTDKHKIIISAVDCTGHGVPGAFMSMLGFNLFNNIVRDGVYEPNQILNKLHRGIVVTLNQESTQNKDGMDMTVCVIHVKQKIIEFAGAQNPLFYIQDGKAKRIKGNKFPVGGHFVRKKQEFTKHIIKADKPTYCYLFSDGFADQFGGNENKKFMTSSLRELLYEIHTRPMSDQKGILKEVTNAWRGDNQQTDDILVIGFKVDL